MARYLIPISMRFTGTTAADSTVWAFRNGSTAPISVRKIVLFAGFDGTAAASSSRFELLRFRTATPSGGTVITVVRMNLSESASTIADARQETAGAALTVTGVVYDTALMTGVSCPRGATGSVASGVYTFENAPLVIAINDGLAIRNATTAVIGDVLVGFMEVEE